MNWEELLAFLQNQVPAGTVTTYGNLSRVFFGGSNAAPAITAMLNGAVNNNSDNCIWTNRVVSSRGQINVPGQLEQLQREGIAIGGNGQVDFTLSRPKTFDDQQPDPPSPPGPTPSRPQSGEIKAFGVFEGMLEQQSYPVIEDLKGILQKNNYERSSFANLIANKLYERLAALLNLRDADLFTLIRLAEDNGLLQNNAVDLAHLIRKTRNQIIHNSVPVETYHARNCLVLNAAGLLWPQLPGQE
ncbi:MAG: hypothetical protein PF495_05660 [Spirochaetales bacterium]|jgi:alkylated DNA nucleotide flippase Atl1|nr:hypothetical protein [Spirochaetales bacterium]